MLLSFGGLACGIYIAESSPREFGFLDTIKKLEVHPL
jgi:hypothetical protein